MVGGAAQLTTISPLKFDADVVAKGVRQRRFDVVRGDRRIPGLLWTPDEDGQRPVVMLGHGASGSKGQDYIVSMARRLVRHHGLCAVAIDGPVHGHRRADGAVESNLAFAEFAGAWSSDDGLIDAMVADWRAVLDAVQVLPEVTPGACGYWGLSMGTIFGLPVCAAEPRVTAAVLGLMGLSGPTRERFAADAASLRCPVLFLVQWHDELFSREHAFALFDALGSPDRRLHANPGLHVEVPGEEFEASGQFLSSHLVV